MLIISDASIENNIVISISYIHRGQEIIAKSVYYTMNVTSTKVKLFAIKYKINCAVHLQDITHIVIITNTISVDKWIFNMFIHPY